MTVTAGSGEITVCPGCGATASEDYGGDGTCWPCYVASHPEAVAPARKRHSAPILGDEQAVDIGFVSPAELRASVPPEPPWIFQGYTALGNLTILAGKPKSGKSTFGLAVTDATGNNASSFLVGLW